MFIRINAFFLRYLSLRHVSGPLIRDCRCVQSNRIWFAFILDNAYRPRARNVCH